MGGNRGNYGKLQGKVTVELEELRIVAAFKTEQLFFNGLDFFGECKERFEDFVLSGFIGEVRDEGVETGDSSGELVAGLAHVFDGVGSVHGRTT